MAGTPKDRTTPTPGTAFGGWQAAQRHTTTAARGAVTRRAGYRGTACAGGYPGGGRRIPGAAGYPAGGYVRGATGRTWRGGYQGGRIYPAAGYRGKRGGCSPNVGGYRARGYLRRRGRATCAGAYTGRAIPGARLPPTGGGRRRGGTATPAGYRAERWRSERAACDGYTPSEITVDGYPGGATGGWGAKKYFCRGGYRGQNPGGYPLRAYIRSLFRAARRGYFLDKTAEK